MTELSIKTTKLLALALNGGAAAGEWQAAAIKAVAEMRKDGVPVEFFKVEPPTDDVNTSDIKMPFGRFKGTPISGLPDWYLFWVCQHIELREPLRTWAFKEMGKRANTHAA